MTRRQASKRIFRRDRRPWAFHQVFLIVAVLTIALSLAMCQADPPPWSLVYLTDSDPAMVREAQIEFTLNYQP
jgi:hypothetical protein